MSSFVWINGRLCDAGKACVSVNNRAFLYGEGLFETLRSYDGKVPFIKDHLQRLEWGSIFLNLEFPSDLDFEKIFAELIEKNGLPNARLKIVLSRRSVAVENGEPVFERDVVVFCEPLNVVPTPQVYRLKTIKSLVNDVPTVAALKSTNYLIKTLARAEARESRCDDGILLNARGHVTETSSANLFWLSADGKLHTVLPSEGLLGGVTKKNLVALLAAKGLKCHEGVITPNEFSSVREAFVTNSVIGVKPVVEVDKRQISGGEIGSVTLQIQELWDKHVKELIS